MNLIQWKILWGLMGISPEIKQFCLECNSKQRFKRGVFINRWRGEDSWTCMRCKKFTKSNLSVMENYNLINHIQDWTPDSEVTNE